MYAIILDIDNVLKYPDKIGFILMIDNSPKLYAIDVLTLFNDNSQTKKYILTVYKFWNIPFGSLSSIEEDIFSIKFSKTKEMSKINNDINPAG